MFIVPHLDSIYIIKDASFTKFLSLIGQFEQPSQTKFCSYVAESNKKIFGRLV